VLGIIGSMDREFSEFGLDPDLKARGRALDERLARLQELWRHGVRRTSHSGAAAGGRANRGCAGPPASTASFSPSPTSGTRRCRWRHSPTQWPLSANSPAIDLRHRLEGATKPGTAAGHIAPYAAAGATWWVEAMGWWRGDLTTARDRITAGPTA
jgi:hypothetical protein